MGKKYLKIIAGCLTLTSLLPLTSCNCSKKKDDEEKKPDPKPIDPPEDQKLGSIKIMSEIPHIKLKKDETYESSTIEVKCFDTKQQQMQSKYNLVLTQLSTNPLKISIVDNKIFIDKNNEIGLYKYQLLATSTDGSIVSNIKYIDIEIYDEQILPDTLEISGSDNIDLIFPNDKTFEYQIIAKKDGQILQDFNDVKTSLNIKSSSTSLTKDLFNNPIFNFEKNQNKLIVSISKNINATYQGNYVVELKVELTNKPSIFYIKTITFNLLDGTSYYDSKYKYYYSRKDLTSQWELKNISSDQQSLNADRFMNEIYDNQVTKIANNFCSTSGINNMVSIELPQYINTIGEYAFDTQEALSQAYIDQVLYIGDYAFNKCSLLKVDSTQHFKLVSLGNYAFKDCQSFKGKYFDDIVTVGEHAFDGTAMKEIHFGDKLSILGADCLTNCSLLKNIYITAQTPPQLMGEIMGGSTPGDCKIHVPISAIDTYRNHPNWTIYQNILVGDITM